MIHSKTTSKKITSQYPLPLGTEELYLPPSRVDDQGRNQNFVKRANPIEIYLAIRRKNNNTLGAIQ